MDTHCQQYIRMTVLLFRVSAIAWWSSMYCQHNLLDSVELGVLSSVVLSSSIVSSLFSSMDLRNCHVTPPVKLPMLRRDLLLTALTLGSWALGSNSMVVMGSGLSWESSPLFDCCSWATELETRIFGMVAPLVFVASWVWWSRVPGKWIQQQYSYCGNHALLCLGRLNVWPITNEYIHSNTSSMHSEPVGNTHHNTVLHFSSATTTPMVGYWVLQPRHSCRPLCNLDWTIGQQLGLGGFVERQLLEELTWQLGTDHKILTFAACQYHPTILELKPFFIYCAKGKRVIMPIFISENFADVLTECFSHCHPDDNWSIQSKCLQSFPIPKLVSEISLSPIYAGATWEATTSAVLFANF